jgi:hypothetical protein
MTNIVSIVQLNEIGYKADIDDVVMCILEPGRCLMAKVTQVANDCIFSTSRWYHRFA